MIILRLLLLLTNLHLKLLSTQGTGADKLLSTQRVKKGALDSDLCLSTLNLINQRNVSHIYDIKLSKYCDIDARLDNH